MVSGGLSGAFVFDMFAPPPLLQAKPRGMFLSIASETRHKKTRF